MIITQTRQSRTFVGSLNTGDDLVEAITNICVENSIFCAFFSGVGYITNPSLERYDAERSNYEPIPDTTGTLHVSALNGNVSLENNQTVVRAHATGTLSSGAEDLRLVSGVVTSGSVIDFEFILNAVDDIRLYRAEDNRTGLNPWLHMELGAQGEFTAKEKPVLEAVRSTRRVSTVPTQSEEDEYDDMPTVDVAIGDFLEHPTLGRSEVIEDGDERVTIRLESGREVELHLSLLTLELVDTTKSGAKHIRVGIKRRR